MKRLLITGSRGFVGSHLTAALEHEYDVTGIDLADGLDLDNPTTFDHFTAPFDAVIHLAGRSYVPDSYVSPAAFYRTNILGTLNLAEFCRKSGIATVIYPNTYVYGSPERLPVDETHPISLPSPYHKSKMLGEQLLSGYFSPDACRVISLRIFNLYGPRQDRRFLIPQLIEQARTEGVVTVKDLLPRRDFLYIRDLVALIRLILQHEAAPAGVYNVGTGQSHSVEEVAKTVFEALRQPSRITSLDLPRCGEIPDCVADSSKAQRVFGWRPNYSLRAGLEDLLNGL